MNKVFVMRHDLYDIESIFTENTAPDWLTSKNNVKGSTIDDRWFWEDYILMMKIGDVMRTDFHEIERIE